MNIPSITAAVLKAWYKQQTIYVGTYNEDFVGVMTDGACMYFIPKKDFPFSIVELLRGAEEMQVEHYIPQNGEDAQLTDEMCVIKKDTAQKVQSEHYTAWLNVKFLKSFAKDAHFKIASEKSPVLVYENDILVGLVCPIFRKKEGNEQ